MGRLFFYSEQNSTGQTERNDKKEERERNDLAEGPRSRTEWNNFKKVGRGGGGYTTDIKTYIL